MTSWMSLSKPSLMQPNPSVPPVLEPLEQLKEYLQNWVSPRAAEIDQSSEALGKAFAGLGARSLLALRVSENWGGKSLSPLDYWQAQRLLARHSGSLAFLQTQHQSAANFIANGSNDALKLSHIAAMARGTRGVGVGFSHLRRRGQPCLTATAGKGGYRLNGTIPWATGFGFFQELVVGATLSDGQSLLALAPFPNQPALNPSPPSLTCSEPMPLAALEVTGTVEMQLNDWFIADEQVIDQKPVGWLDKSDRHNVLKATSFLIGCSEAALTVMQQQRLPSNETWAQLNHAVQDCQHRILQAMAAEVSFEAKLALRAEAIALCHRCAQAAVLASGGAANLLSHPAQRIYREALVFGVSGQTHDLKTSSLNAIAPEGPDIAH